MTASEPETDGIWQDTIDLPTGCRVQVDESRSLVELPIPKIRGDCGTETDADTPSETGSKQQEESPKLRKRRWKAISSAIWRGGFRHFEAETSSGEDAPSAAMVRVFNYKVPSDYDGLHPEPKSLLQTAIQKEFATKEEAAESGAAADASCIGIMTAASMRSLRWASRSAGGVVVDAIVTAGISNARAAGADADFFGILPPEAREPQQQEQPQPPPGTINTVVIINGASLTPQALIEAYAIAIEAKCGACADYAVTCAKTGDTTLAQGTGTDCCVLLSPSLPPSEDASIQVSYAGKHCLLAELIGQAVKEATGQAILSNVVHCHGSLWRYHASRWLRASLRLLQGARPCVPAKPMDPVPKAPPQVLGLGGVLVVVCYGLYTQTCILSRSGSILLAAAAWDRCLFEPPLSVHPVVLAGTVISLATQQWMPERVFDPHKPVLGFCAGLAFSVATVAVFGSIAHGVVWLLRSNSLLGGSGQTSLLSFGAWVLEVILVKTTFSLQLLCTIALQMAGFLERAQLKEARAQLAWLCSRDSTHLNAKELAGGTLESLAENLSDGTVAPWFWYVLLGPVGALGYRIANTLDSRIGYRGGRYEYFGKAAARFDDLINLIPARLTTAFLCLAARNVPGCSPSGGLQTAWQDRRQCSSPNAGWPMGAMAGILGVHLEKRGEYCLGKDIPGASGPTPMDIRNGHKVAQLAGGIALVTAVGACSLFAGRASTECMA